MKVQPYNKVHRTALVIDTRNGFEGAFAERVNRLLQSVNGPNIKVDVFHIVGGEISAGTPSAAGYGFKPASQAYGSGVGEATIVPGAPGSTVTATTADGVAEQVRKALPDYDQVLVSLP